MIIMTENDDHNDDNDGNTEQLGMRHWWVSNDLSASNQNKRGNTDFCTKEIISNKETKFGNTIKYIYSCQFDVTDKQGAETKRLEKFLVVVRQMRHEGLKSLTTNSNKIWQKWINGWNGGILFNLSDLVRQTETLKIFEEIAKGVFL